MIGLSSRAATDFGFSPTGFAFALLGLRSCEMGRMLFLLCYIDDCVYGGRAICVIVIIGCGILSREFAVPGVELEGPRAFL